VVRNERPLDQALESSRDSCDSGRNGTEEAHGAHDFKELLVIAALSPVEALQLGQKDIEQHVLVLQVVLAELQAYILQI